MKKKKKNGIKPDVFRNKAINILEICRHFDLNYTKGDKDHIRHLILHDEDPFTNQEIKMQIKRMKDNPPLNLPRSKTIDLNPKFKNPITGEEMQIEKDGQLLF